jgi:hypothetical protein
MSRTDALGFLTTAAAVLVMNAVPAVAIGSSFYTIRYVYQKMKQQAAREEHLAKIAMGGVR